MSTSTPPLCTRPGAVALVRRHGHCSPSWPSTGAFIVWIPAAIFLAPDGSWGSALILTAWGTLVVGMIDNLLYPMLVGNRLKLHSIPSFVSRSLLVKDECLVEPVELLLNRFRLPLGILELTTERHPLLMPDVPTAGQSPTAH